MSPLLYRILLITAICLPISAIAAPWAGPNDGRLRSAVNWLADRGCLAAPVTTWPIMWADLQLSQQASANCEQSLAWQYVRFERHWAQRSLSGSLSLSGSDRSPVFRGFGSTAREKEDVTVTLEAHSSHWALGLSPHFVPEPHGLDRDEQRNQFRLDGSYLAASYGNWVLGAGAINRWWGPGWRSSLILGNNSRPVPAVFVSRRKAQAFDFPILEWLGPWTFTAFAGQLESDRYVPRTKLLGMRLAFKPVSWLEIGASRTIQWAGEGRPHSFHNLMRALSGVSDNVHGSTKKEPGNQLAGFDFRIGLPLGDTSTFSLYGQLIGEDEAGGLPSRNIAQIGMGAAGHWWAGKQRIVVEYTNTTVNAWTSEKRPNTAYEHHIYRSGYHYYGRSLGATWGSNARVASLAFWQYFANGSNLGLVIDSASLNRDGISGLSSSYQPTPVASVTGNQDVMRYRLSYRQPFLNGRLSLSVVRLSEPLVTQTETYDETAFMASWEYRFAL